MENQNKPFQKEDKDIDLGSLLYLISKGVSRIGRNLNIVLNAFFNLLLKCLLFLKRKALWIILGFLIGLAYGTYLNWSKGNKYYSSLTARFNFNSNRSLYNTIDYLNALIAEENDKDLARLLNISETEANRLVQFSAEPMEDELTISQIYRKQFLDYNRSSQIRTDTFWTKIISYKDFKKTLTKYDIPIQEITAITTQANIFPKLQDGLINKIQSDGILEATYAITQTIFNDEEKIITSSIRGLDTLRNVYNERLRNQALPNTPTSSMTVLGPTQITPTPELELYDKILELKDELKILRKDILDNQKIVQVYSSFAPVGNKVNILRQNSSKYAYRGVIIALFILILIEAIKALKSYESEQKP